MRPHSLSNERLGVLEYLRLRGTGQIGDVVDQAVPAHFARRPVPEVDIDQASRLHPLHAGKEGVGTVVVDTQVQVRPDRRAIGLYPWDEPQQRRDLARAPTSRSQRYLAKWLYCETG